jgi:hypothetical protein
MPWTINGPTESDDPETFKYIQTIRKALRSPNRSLLNTYRKLVTAIVKDLLIWGVALVERQPGEANSQPFWLWVQPVYEFELDKEWRPDIEGIHPRFWHAPRNKNTGAYSHPDPAQWTPIKSDRLFMIQHRVRTDVCIAKSPVQCAYDDVATWLELHEYQNSTVSNPVRDYMICLLDSSQTEVRHFRQYWETEVRGSGTIPIVGGSVEVKKFGAKNDDELFLKYTEFLMGLIALEFNLSKREFGIDPHDNRSTFGPAADLSFQHAILPIAKCVVEEHLNQEVIQFYSKIDDINLILSDTEPRKESEEAQTAKTLFESQIIDRNEARSRVGADPLQEEKNGFMSELQPQGEVAPEPEQTQPPMPPKKSSPVQKIAASQKKKPQWVQLELFN